MSTIVCVIGAGKMGLPLACQMASRGAKVTACDANPQVVALINRGECPFEEPGVPELLRDMVAQGRLRASTDTPAAVRESAVVVTIVPVLLTPDNEADLRIIEAVTRDIASALRPGTMVAYETTLPVGTTRSFVPALERSGLRAGLDFDLVFSPERVKSKHVLKHLSETPKIVGALTPAGAERAAVFYGEYLGAPTINVGTLEASEFAKLAGMVYRDVNIALANELARYAEHKGLEVGPIFGAANTDGESYLLFPGIGVGGHCTPVYPYFVINDAHRARLPQVLSSEARRVNDSQASYQINRLEQAWQPLRGKRVCILGLGFRPGVKEHTCSTAFLLRDDLLRRGAICTLHDPLYSDKELREHQFEPGPIAGEVLILNTAHQEYQNLDFATLAEHGLRAVLDGRNLWQPATAREHGLIYLGMGIGA